MNHWVHCYFITNKTIKVVVHFYARWTSKPSEACLSFITVARNCINVNDLESKIICLGLGVSSCLTDNFRIQIHPFQWDLLSFDTILRITKDGRCIREKSNQIDLKRPICIWLQAPCISWTKNVYFTQIFERVRYFIPPDMAKTCVLPRILFFVVCRCVVFLHNETTIIFSYTGCATESV